MARQLWGPVSEEVVATGGSAGARLEGSKGSEVRDWPKVKVTTAGYECREAFISTVALDRINTIKDSVWSAAPLPPAVFSLAPPPLLLPVQFSLSKISPVFTSFFLPSLLFFSFLSFFLFFIFTADSFNQPPPRSPSFAPSLMEEQVQSWYWPPVSPRTTPRLTGPAEKRTGDNSGPHIVWTAFY